MDNASTPKKIMLSSMATMLRAQDRGMALSSGLITLSRMGSGGRARRKARGNNIIDSKTGTKDTGNWIVGISKVSITTARMS